jgi:ATP-binding cassette subfamily B protein
MTKVDNVIRGRIPEAVRRQAEGIGLTDNACLFSASSDIGLDGRQQEVWLLVTETTAVALAAGEEAPVSGPFPLQEVEKVRIFQTVGSAFLQFMVGGLYVEVMRFSNARRELLDRVRIQVERLLKGEPLQEEALLRPSEWTCLACGLPLPARGAACPRCQGGRGLFLRALALMKPYWIYSLLLLGLMLIRVGLNLVPPYLVKILVDDVLEAKQHLGWLMWFVMALLGVAVVVCMVNIIIGRSTSAIGTRVARELRQTLHDKLMKLSVEYFDRNSVGSLMSRVLYDVEYFQGFVNQVSEGFLLNLLLVVGIGAMLFYMNWQLALLVLLPIPLVVIGTTIFWKHIYPRYYPVWDSQSKMAQLLSGVLSGIRLVKSFGQEERERRRFAGSAGYIQDARRSLQSSVATFNPLMVLIFGLGSLIIWYYGGQLVFKGEAQGGVSLGTLMAFFSYVAMFYGPVQALSMFSNWMTGYISAGQRVFEVLDAAVTLEDEARPAGLPRMRGSVEFRDVTFGYDPHNPVLKNVSFRIEPGQFFGIVGKSGSGKTTLVNLICRFYDVQQGEVLIDGTDVRKLRQEDIHGQVALVLQEPFLFRASIRDNIAYAQPDADPTSVIRAARTANAHEFISRLPSGYDTRLGERGAGLSGGERQRVTIARGMIRSPRILILDEATSSVDTESEQEIQRALGGLSKQHTTIVIAHRLSTLKNADHILVMDDGRIVESGTHDELMDQGGLYARLIRIQTELARIETG